MTIMFMLLMHLVADYTLQGWLAQGKQKSWWREQTKDEKYKHDYKCALLCHSLYWSILCMLPLHFHGAADCLIILLIVANTIVHYIIDDLKANHFKINLWQDQACHFVQLLVSYAVA